ncbi:MAG: ATP-binding cassette domain-containing protein [Defluviitaleaceae bacterium]|nr:ATP-binding cassette domain-containing protein [Defluviitaleaceae bacterium]
MKIEINDISKTYASGKQALKNINIQMESPNLIGILGPNGAGKTTLMKLLIAGLTPTSGEILLDGKRLLSQEKELKSKLGYLPQSFGLFDELTVWQFIDYMAALKDIKDKSAIETVLEQVNLTNQRKTRIRRLSGGMRQRVGIAQALLGNPQLIILDEPTVGLDPEERVKFRNIFSEMARDKIVLLSTHIVEDVQSICNRVLVLNGGKTLFDGEPADLVAKTAGHVGVFVSQIGEQVPRNCQVVSKVNTAKGIQCRIIANELPDFAEAAEPTLEDAYLYCTLKGGDVL